MEKQMLRNSLSDIEDAARSLRNSSNIHNPREAQMLDLIVQLTQLVREEIVQ